MRKAILVDDEMFARRGLVGLIPWEKCGFQIVGEAEDGEEALALIEREMPDLVITDIRMPVLDGLELIQTVQERISKEIKFIIISGYGDFKYAQQAVRYGVHDYLLKPIDENELMETLGRINEMLNERPTWQEGGKLLFQISLFEQLLSGKSDEKLLADASQYLGLPIDKPLRYVALELNNVPSRLSEDEKNEQIGELKEAVIKVVKRHAPDQEPFIYIPSPYGLGFLIPSSDPKPDGVKRLADDLIRGTTGIGECVTSVYIGERTAGLDQVKASYMTAMETMKYKFAQAPKAAILYDDIKGTALQYKELEQTQYTELMERLEEHDSEAITKLVDAMFAAFREQGFALESMRASISRCVHGATRIIQTMQGDVNKLASFNPIMHWDNEPRTLESVKGLLMEFLTECTAYMASLRSKIGKGEIGKIKSYIESHYASNISLKSIAKLFYMNPVYLGQLFKKSYGMYFNEFLLQIRIQEAKSQLRQTDKKIYEIAANVGFGNADYFVCQFEKVEGKTPTEYKNAMIAKT
ncbi:response regulator [Paenibacillus sp. CF384]|uniref:response regulator transcription factor n=1 Tax=Paenibacillus sp. CF384 TaxID=1884382 RepID=UPI00089CB132|nr:response regulator [Paenibacillus sp. CF384]SDX98570.1 two-component system, response regulator YesN [Paenibacillus sp. CF384]